MERVQRPKAGFSLLEIMVVIALTGIVSAVALVQMQKSLALVDADEAANVVTSQLNYARQLAVDQRRNILIGFLNSNEIKVTRDELGGGTTLMADVNLPSGYQFGRASGIGDTPDGYGPNGVPVDFNAGTGGSFLGDGTFVDSNNVLLNGTVFTIGSGNDTARAVTLSGSAGRIKGYLVKVTGGTSTWMAR